LLRDAEKISIDEESLEFFKDKFCIDQAEMKLKMSEESEDGKREAIKWA
jgi:hypothetical protein